MKGSSWGKHNEFVSHYVQMPSLLEQFLGQTLVMESKFALLLDITAFHTYMIACGVVVGEAAMLVSWVLVWYLGLQCGSGGYCVG